MIQLHEQYRPRTWSDVVGQGKAIDRIQTIARRGIGGRAWMINGASGTGKSTLARLIALEIASDECIEEIDAGACTPAALRDIETGMSYYGMGAKSGRAYIINESHALGKAAVNQLLVLLERLPSHVVVIFTTTNENLELFADANLNADPLLSRCQVIELARRDICRPMAERVKWIAEREQLDGQPVEKYVKLLQECRNNMRMALQEIEAGRMIAR